MKSIIFLLILAMCFAFTFQITDISSMSMSQNPSKLTQNLTDL